MVVDRSAVECDTKGCYSYYSDRLCILVTEDFCVPAGAIAHSINCKVAVWCNKAMWVALRPRKAGLGLRVSVGAIRVPPRARTHLVVQLDNLYNEPAYIYRGDRLLFLTCDGCADSINIRLE